MTSLASEQALERERNGPAKPTIVSLTPLAVERDSRTFKQAASMARLGYESIVIEGEPSRAASAELPFRLPGEAPASGTAPSAGAQVEQGARTRAGRISRLLPARVERVLRTLLEPPYFIVSYLLSYGLRTVRRTPDASLYYLHSFRQFPAVYLKCRRGRIPFIYDAHDFYPATYEERPPTPAQRAIDRFRIAVERICARRASEVVTVSEGVARLFEQQFGRRPLVIRNCHDRRIDTEPATGLRGTLGLSAGAMVVVAAGNAKEGSAASEAIAAMLSLPEEVHLAFVGAGYERYDGEIARLGVTHRVHRIPPVAPTELVPFIESADLGLIPYVPLSANFLHSLPNRFFSAIAAGLPLLYPEGMPEMRALAERHGLGIGIDPQDPTSVASAVQSLLDDRASLARYREAALKAREILGWEAEEATLGTAIRAVLGDG